MRIWVCESSFKVGASKYTLREHYAIMTEKKKKPKNREKCCEMQFSENDIAAVNKMSQHPWLLGLDSKKKTVLKIPACIKHCIPSVPCFVEQILTLSC